MLQLVIRTALMLFAGWGVSSAVDKVAADKVPNYQPVSLSATGITPMKIAFWLGSMVIGALVAKWIGKKFNIKLLK